MSLDASFENKRDQTRGKIKNEELFYFKKKKTVLSCLGCRRRFNCLSTSSRRCVEATDGVSQTLKIFHVVVHGSADPNVQLAFDALDRRFYMSLIKGVLWG